MKDYSGLTVLIIDPSVGMRGNFQNMLSQFNINKIDYAVSSGTAVRIIGKKSFDIILCEYDLGNGQDGQQLLEDLRHHHLIRQWTIFIIVTSESFYEKVVSAAEFAPTDYILKPFTTDLLQQRITRAIEKRTVFFPVYLLIGQGNPRDAIKACEKGEANTPRYAVDFLRLRAELHASLGELAEAEKTYLRILEMRSMAWAHLGLAKTLFAQKRFPEAEQILTKLVSENNRYMDAYDWLAKVNEAIGQQAEAKTVLEEAVAISPNVVRRLRKLGEVAFETGDIETAERSFKQVIGKAKYSEFRDPEDHVKLVQTLVKKGDTAQATTIVRDLEKSLRGTAETLACCAISNAMLHDSMGQAESAVAELTNAVTACREPIQLSSDMKITLAKNCLVHHLDEGAKEIMLNLVNNAASGVSTEQAMNVFERAGRHDLAEGIGNALKKQLAELMASAADKSSQGDYKGAVAAMLEAAHIAPDNPQVLYSAAAAVFKYLDELGWDHAMGEQGRSLIENARLINSSDPQLASLTNLYQQIKRKYGIAA